MFCNSKPDHQLCSLIRLLPGDLGSLVWHLRALGHLCKGFSFECLFRQMFYELCNMQSAATRGQGRLLSPSKGKSQVFLAMEMSLSYSVSLSLDATRKRAFGLVSQAYTSIVADDFAAFVGLPVEEAVKGTWHFFTESFFYR